MATKNQNHLRIVKPNNFYSREDFNFRLKDINLGPTEQYRAINQYQTGNPSQGKNSFINRNIIPYVKLTEFEPDMFFKMTQHLKMLINMLQMAGTATLKGLNVAEEFIEDFVNKDLNSDGQLGTRRDNNQSRNNLISNFTVDENTENTYEDQILSAPLRLYRSFFNGKYVRSFEIPNYDETYLYSDGNSGWNTNTNIDFPFFGEYLDTIWKTITNLGIIDLPAIPRWNWDGSNQEDYFGITTTFNLVNNNLQNLARNFKFLINLIQGPFWIQYNSRQFPPNIYSVDIPGVMFLQYAKMTVNVTTNGNRRKVPDNFYGLLRGANIFRQQSEDELFKDGLVYFPDVWEVTVILRSLVPNTFNNYLNYLLLPTDNEIGITTDSYIETGDLRSNEA